jgi:hypothetical protein
MSDKVETVQNDSETPWLDNGFDEAALRRYAKQELEDAMSATPQPRNWRVVEVDYEPS